MQRDRTVGLRLEQASPAGLAARTDGDGLCPLGRLPCREADSVVAAHQPKPSGQALAVAIALLEAHTADPGLVRPRELRDGDELAAGVAGTEHVGAG
ncbi:MAG TPA: hypothetical protein PLE80_12545, partial [Opitutaceae bacterium]|nr:hypothetical protein [Opitutaceae bacterium]